MIKSKKRKEIVTNWVLSNTDYHKLQDINKELADFLYNLSWKGFENLKNNFKYESYLNKSIIGTKLCSEFYSTYNFYDSYYWNNYKGTTMVNPDKVNLSTDLFLNKGTLCLNIGKISKRNLKKIRDLLSIKLELTKSLKEKIRAITNVLIDPNINITYVKKYFPGLIQNEKSTI